MLYIYGGFGITGGAHRLWAHRSYKASWPLRLFLALGQTLAVQVSSSPLLIGLDLIRSQFYLIHSKSLKFELIHSTIEIIHSKFELIRFGLQFLTTDYFCISYIPIYYIL